MRSIRETLGVSQEELARRAMVSRNYISLIESGKKTPSLRLLRVLKSLLTSPAAPPAHKVTVTPKHEVEIDPPVIDARAEEVSAKGWYGSRPKGPATIEDCRAYFEELLHRALESGDANALPYIYRRLEEALPLHAFRPARDVAADAERDRLIEAAANELPARARYRK